MATDWTPTLSKDGPRYRALADAIGEAAQNGALAPGARLPAVRELAWRLSVTPGTVARAYQLAESRGLVEGRVGSGTYLVDRQDQAEGPTALSATDPPPEDDARADGIDLTMNCAVDVGQDAAITAALERLMTRRRPLPLTDYCRFGEDGPERAAGADWLRSGGVPARAADLVVTAGAQQGVLTALAATCAGPDAVALTEPLIHPGLKDCARALGLRLSPVAVDDEGMIPEALDEACRRQRPSAIILTANNQNPLLTTMGPARRAAIAAVVAARRIPVVEDDVYGWLVRDRAESLPSLIPDLCWYIASFSKCVAAGIRVGYLLTPPGEGPRAARILQGYTQHVSWLLSALAAELVQSGDAAAIIQNVARETARRSVAVEAALTPALQAGRGRLTRVRTSTMAWLELPEPWRAAEFTAAAQRAGARIMPAEAFAVGRAPAPHAVRLAFGATRTRAQAAEGARRLADLLTADPSVEGIQDMRA